MRRVLEDLRLEIDRTLPPIATTTSPAQYYRTPPLDPKTVAAAAADSPNAPARQQRGGRGSGSSPSSRITASSEDMGDLGSDGYDYEAYYEAYYGDRGDVSRRAGDGRHGGDGGDGAMSGERNNKANLASPKFGSYFVDQGLVGQFLQAATWIFSSPFADSPTFVDNWLRCSTLSR